MDIIHSTSQLIQNPKIPLFKNYLCTRIEIFVRDGVVVPDNVKRGLLDHQVGNQGQRGVSC